MDSDDVLGTTVLHDVADGVATITLNRPEAANALRADQRDVMIELLERGGRRHDGAGRSRCVRKEGTSARVPTSAASAPRKPAILRWATACAG